MYENDNPLFNIFFENTGNSIHKWIDYFAVYHRFFSPFRGKKIKVLEIGVQNGGSTRMWKKYFGDLAEIVCVDIDPACKELEAEGFEVWIGDQGSKVFWDDFKMVHNVFDIIIEDGGHHMSQQIQTFESLFPIVIEGGIFLCEDTHTSYMPSFGGGLKQQGSFVEYTKNLIDKMHGWYYKPLGEIENDLLLNCIYSINYFDSIVVVEKRKKLPPVAYARGSAGHITNPLLTTYVDLRRAVGISDF